VKQPDLIHEADLFPPRAGAAPILRWVGGKSWLVPLICPGIHRYLRRSLGRYIEPFLGGAAVALDLGLPRMILGDLCAPLIDMYRTVRSSPKNVAHVLRQMKETDYYKVRGADFHRPGSIATAARFLYLNRTCFNGLYRENKRGKFNVPKGDIIPRFPTEKDLQSVQSAFLRADLAVASYQETIEQAKRGDVVYADPPYLGVYDGYNATGFGLLEHRQLAECLGRAVERGAAVIATNSDTEEVRRMYADMFATPVEEQRTVAAKGSSRGRAKALLITSDESLLG
jgi:DNA adenine methylase